MALVTKNFTLNVTPGAMPVTVHVSEYDIGRTYAVQLLGENGSSFEIPSGTTATIEGTLNGTVGFSTSATISNNQITFALTESMTAYSGKAWCKIKLTLNSEHIQTCAFILAVDRAGVEAETVIGADGFEQQIVNAVNNWLDLHPPASGGMTEEFKQALLDCFENVAWINDDGQTYYDALYAALYPPVDVLSISAVFTQGSAEIYDTDDLDTLRQYLVVTATMTDSTTQTVTAYTLSGTLTVGTSTITVSYGGKTTTFNVTVTERPDINIFDPTTAITLNCSILNVSSNPYISTTGTAAKTHGKYIPIFGGHTYKVILPMATGMFRVASTNAVPADNVSVLDTSANHSGTEITIQTSSNAYYLLILYYDETVSSGIDESAVLSGIEVFDQDAHGAENIFEVADYEVGGLQLNSTNHKVQPNSLTNRARVSNWVPCSSGEFVPSTGYAITVYESTTAGGGYVVNTPEWTTERYVISGNGTAYVKLTVKKSTDGTFTQNECDDLYGTAFTFSES